MFRKSLAGPIVAGLMLVVCVGPARAQELVENPAYASWAKHQPGTTVTMQMDTDAGGQKMTMEIVQKLAEVTAEGATVDVTTKMNMMGQNHEQTQKQTIPAQVPKEQADRNALPPNVQGTMKEVGTETVEIGGESYECTVHEFTGTQEGTQTTGKIWRCDNLPGQLAKMEANTTGGPMKANVTMKVTGVELK